MKISQIHVFHNPRRDAIMVVHKPAVVTKDDKLIALDRTNETMQAVVAWVLQEHWEGYSKLPPVLRWWERLKAFGLRRPMLYIAADSRAVLLPHGKIAKVTVQVFQEVGEVKRGKEAHREHFNISEPEPVVDSEEASDVG